MKTNHLSKILVVSVITLIGFAIAGTISIATTQKEESNIQEKVSSEANTAIRDLRWARVALFDGQPEAAKTYLGGVKKTLKPPKSMAPKWLPRNPTMCRLMSGWYSLKTSWQLQKKMQKLKKPTRISKMVTRVRLSRYCARRISMFPLAGC